MQVEFDDEKHELRMIESESVLAYSDEKPSGLQIGKEYGPETDTGFGPHTAPVEELNKMSNNA